MLNPMMGAGNAMPWMILGQVLIWVAVIVGIVLVTRAFATTLGSRQEAPLDIIQGRLARGEISREEYESVRRVLTEPAARDVPAPGIAPRSAP